MSNFFAVDEPDRLQFLEDVFHHVNQAIFIIDVEADGTFRYAGLNDSYERLAGLSASDLVGKTPSDLVPILPAETVRTVERHYQDCVDAGTVIEYEEHLPIHGEDTWWLTRLMPIHRDGRVHRIVGSSTRITELCEARRTAEAAVLAHREFVAHLSHDIRTPLVSILSASELLSSHDLPAPTRELVDLLQHSVSQLEDTLESVLALSRLTAQAVTPTYEWVVIDALLRDRLEAAAPHAEEADVKLDATLPPGINLHTDRRALIRIVDNLLSNAIKYTKLAVDGDQLVHLVLDADDDRITLQVSDTGIGIPPDFLPHLFDPFTRQVPDTTPDVPGSGLGLAITKQLVDLLDGTITVDSTPGDGTTFTVHLPRRQAAHP